MAVTEARELLMEIRNLADAALEHLDAAQASVNTAEGLSARLGMEETESMSAAFASVADRSLDLMADLTTLSNSASAILRAMGS